jgi:hypothetical protein
VRLPRDVFGPRAIKTLVRLGFQREHQKGHRTEVLISTRTSAKAAVREGFEPSGVEPRRYSLTLFPR